MKKINLSKKSQSKIDTDTIKPLCLKTAVLIPFSVPIRNITEVNNALRLRYRSLFNRESPLLFISQILETGKNGTRGVLWFISQQETKNNENIYGPHNVIWPAPLAFVPKEKNAKVICKDGKGLSSIIYYDGKPVIYRYTEECIDELEKWLDTYIQSSNMPEMETKVYDIAELSLEQLDSYMKNSVELLPGLTLLNLSDHAINNVRKHENMVQKTSQILQKLFVAGIVVTLIAGCILLYSKTLEKNICDTPSKLYKTMFSEYSASPVASLHRKMKVVGGSKTAGLSDVMDIIARSWCDGERVMTLDSIRYGVERVEVHGTADTTEAIQNFKDNLNKNGCIARTGAVEQAGEKMRFTIFITEVKQ